MAQGTDVGSGVAGMLRFNPLDAGNPLNAVEASCYRVTASADRLTAARAWIAERSHDPERIIGPAHFKPEHLRFYVSDWIERLTGTRVFEFRNYEVV